MSQELPAEIRAELAQRVEKLVVAGMDRALARRRVWDEYQDDLVSIANQMHRAAEPAPPELPPPKPLIPQAKPRADSGEHFFTPERMAKSRSELAKIKQQLGIKA